MKFIYPLLLLLSILCMHALAQGVYIERSTQTVQENKKTYYLHTVKKGETLYSICKAYAVTQADIEEDNPGIRLDVLAVGQVLRIAQAGSEATPAAKKTTTYIYHATKDQETLYSIARRYGVGVDDIVEANPGVDKGLRSGFVLRIPIESTTTAKPTPTAATATTATTPGTTKPTAYTAPTATPTPAAAPQASYMLEHKVKVKETLYSIANLYEVSMKDIRQSNPEIFPKGNEEALREGSVLLIPILTSGIGIPKDTAGQLAVTAPVVVNCSTPMQTPVNVLLILPFNTPAADTSADALSRSFAFAEMYEGVRQAIQVLSQQGVSVNLNVVDAYTIDQASFFTSAAFVNAHLIIGPIYPDRFGTIARKAHERNIPIVSPLTPIDASLHPLGNVYQVPASGQAMLNKLIKASPLAKSGANTLLIAPQDLETQKRIRATYQSYLPMVLDSVWMRNSTVKQENTAKPIFNTVRPANIPDTAKLLAYRTGLQPRNNFPAFMRGLRNSGVNNVIVASDDEPFVSDVIASLRAFTRRYPAVKISVYGTAQWRKFENIELRNLYDLNLHVAVPYYTNYKDANVIKFIEAYRYRTKTEPSQFAFQGYDVALYFIGAVYQFGTNLGGCINNYQAPLLQSAYRFEPIQPNGAYQNTGAFLLEYQKNINITVQP